MLVDLAVIGYFVTLGLWFEFYEGHGLLPSCSPNIETVYAMTIHKNQGSEFESVYLCLPFITANNQGRRLDRVDLYWAYPGKRILCCLIRIEC
jgi:hypothetical protein